MDVLVNSGFIVLFLTLLVGSISYVVNDINATPLEKKLQTNFEKIKVFSSLAFIIALVIVVITLIVMLLKGEMEETPIVTFLLAVIVILIIIFVVVFIYIVIVDYLFSKYRAKKFDFFVILNDGSEWKIIRVTGSNYLLIKSDQKEEYRLIKDYDNLSIRAIEIEKTKRK